jgi:DNA primase
MTAEDEEIARLRALAMAGAGALRTGQQWQAWLDHAERFADLGFVNTMLVWAQRPDAVLVRDYAQWQRLGRQVKRGERGIRLVTATRDRRVGREHVTTVFDLLQTNGKPRAVRVKRTRYGGKLRPESWRALASLALPDGTDAAAAEWTGWFAGTHDGAEMAAALALVRRVARELVGEDRGGLAGIVEADSVAFLIALRLGLDTSEFVFPRIGSWAGTDPRAPVAAVVAATGERILAAAGRAFERIDPRLVSAVEMVTGPRLISKELARRPAPADSSRILEEAARFFTGRMADSWVPGYLAGRGFGEAVQRQWGIGHAPDGWTTLTEHLRALGYSDPAIEASGLAVRSSRGTLIDAFRDRAMFPVRSANAVMVGFLGRAAPGADKDVPKCLNTRETGLYRKGQVLFGLHEGRTLLASGARAVIVEGPLDAIAVTAAGGGRYVGVAPCGTALTADQVALLRRLGGDDLRGPIVAFDGDQAGRKAAVRAYELLHEADLEPMAVEFPDGQDPAGLYGSQGGETLLRVLGTQTHPLADMAIDAKIEEFGHWLEFLEGKFSALHTVAPMIARLPVDNVARQVARVADRLGLTHAEVTEAVTDAVQAPEAAPPIGRSAVDGRLVGERHLLQGARHVTSTSVDKLPGEATKVRADRAGTRHGPRRALLRVT